jgi:hypothetical protein
MNAGRDYRSKHCHSPNPGEKTSAINCHLVSAKKRAVKEEEDSPIGGSIDSRPPWG